MNFSRFLSFKCIDSRWIVGLFSCFITVAQGQVKTDNTFGPSIDYGTGDATIPASSGKLSGANLFHSFETFNINTGNTVEFTNGSTVSIENVISRVTGGNASAINGILKSTVGGADFFFVNPAGVTFGVNGSVDIPASFFVSTADRLEFVNGEDFVVSAINPALSMFDPKDYGFVQPGQQTVIVMGDVSVNDGSNFTIVTRDLEVADGSIGVGSEQSNITVVADGDVSIAQTDNGGILSADEGGSITIDANGSVTVKEGALITASSSGANPAGSISINGTSFTLASEATLRAARVGDSTEEIDDGFSGEVIAWSETVDRTNPESGAVVVSGGDGDTTIAGNIDVSSGSDQVGGSVKIAGQQVDVQGTATITASGETGGGDIEIGGGYQGASMGADLSNSQLTIVEAGASISADAIQTGDGGAVVVWSEDRTGYSGSITATGGAASGDGGSVEVSGKRELGFDGIVNTTAPNGNAGSLLLDPDNIEINVANGDDDQLLGPPLPADYAILAGDSPGTDFVISPGALESALTANGSVELQAAISITQNSPVDLSVAGAGTGVVTMSTTNGPITFNDEFTGGGGNLNITAGGVAGDVLINDDLSNAGNVNITAGSTITDGPAGTLVVSGNTGLTATGAITLDSANNDFVGGVSASGAAVTLSDANDLQLADIDATTSLTATAITGSITDTATDGEAITTPVATLSAVAGDVTLDNDSANALQAHDFDTVSATGGSITIDDVDNLILGDINATNAAGTLDVDAGGAITQVVAGGAGTAVNAAGTSDFDAGANDITLGSALNDFVGGVSASGAAVTLSDANDLQLADIDATTSLTATATTGSITDTATDGEAIMTPVATLSAVAGNVTLDNDSANALQAHDFDTVSATGGSITIDDVDNLILGDINATNAAGTLDVDAGGAITQVVAGGAGTAVNAAGTSDFDAGANDITLGSALNDFVGGVSASGAAVTLSDANNLQLADIDATTSLTATATTGSITDTATDGESIMTPVATLSAVAGDVTLDNDSANALQAHDFDTVSATGGSITIDDVDNLILGDINATNAAGTLDVDAGGAITQVVAGGAGTAVNAAGTSDFDAGANDITLGSALNDFVGGVSASGAAVTLSDANDLQLADIDATTSLTATATTGSITDTATDGESIMTPVATLSAVAGDVTLDNDSANALQAHDFDTVSATGGSITIDDVDNLILGDINATNAAGTLDVDAGGAITQVVAGGAGTAVNAAGTSDFDAGANDITLGSALNDFVGGVSVSGAAVTLSDANDLQLADIDATGDLSVTSTGTITDTAGQAINAGGATTLDAGGFDIQLDNVGLHDFAENADFNASGGDITVEDIDGIQLGAVTLASNTDPTIGTNAGDLTLTANGAVTQTGALTVPGETQVTTTADTVTLDNAGNDFTGSVSVDTGTGADVELTDANAIVLGTVTADALTVTAGGTITDTASEAITANGVTTLDAGTFDIQLDNTGAGAHDFAENADFNASGGDITVEDVDGIQLGTVTLAANTDPTIGTNAGDLTLTANGAVTQTGALTVPGETQVTTTADTVTLDNAGNDFTGSVSVDTGTGADVELTDANAIVLGTVTADALTVTAGGTITDTASEAITANGVTTLDAGTFDIQLDNTGAGAHDFAENADFNASGGDITVEDIDGIQLGTVTLAANTDPTIGTNAGDLTLTANGAVTQTGALTVPGETQVTTTADTVTLDNAGNDFTGSVSVDTGSGADVELTDANAIVLGTVTADALTVTSGGTITDTAGEAILASGETTLDAGTFDIQLDNTGAGAHDFAENADFNASGGDITVEDIDGIQLGTVTLAANTDPTIGTNAGDLTLTANGAVTQTGALTVPGETQVTTTADTVTLDNAGNDFTGSVSVDTGSGADVELTDANAIVLGTVTADALTVTAGGTITDTASEVITANGVTTLDAGTSDIVLDNVATHDFVGAVSASGANITVNDANAIELADIDATGNLSVTAVGAIDDGVVTGTTTDVDVVGTSTFVSSSNANITVDDNTNEFGGAVSASGTDVTLGDASAIELGNIDALGNLVVSAVGSIDDGPETVLGGDVDVTGTSTLVSTGGANVIVDDTTNEFVGAVTASGADVALGDTSAIVLADIDATGDLSVTSTGTITDTAGQAINAGGATTLDAGGFDIQLDNAGLHDFAENADFNASGGDITVEDIDGIQLGTVTLASNTDPTIGTNAGDLTLTANGAVTQTGPLTVPGETQVTTTADTVTLDNAGNDFTGSVSVDTGSGADVELTDANAIVLGEVTADALTVTTGGTITDTAGEAINASGATTFDAGTFDIQLDNTGAGAHDFAENADFNASGGDITVEDVDGIQLGTVTLAANTDPTIGTNAGDLTLTANGAVTQTGALTVPGETQVTTTADTVTLDNAGNDFTGSVSVDTGAGADVELTDANAIVLGTVTADALTVTAGGTITDTASEVITANGVTTLDAGTSDIVLDNVATHDFVGAVSASGANITVNDANAIELADIDATGNLSVTAVGAIDDGVVTGTTTDVDVVGTSTFVSSSNANITVDDNTNEFGGAVSASGTDVTLGDASAIELGNIDALGNLVVSAVGSIDDGPETVLGGDVDVTGTSTLVSTGGANVIVDDTTNEFVGAVTASGADVALGDTSAIVLADIDATGDLSVTSTGTITDTAGQAINAGGATTLDAGGFDIQLDNAGLHDFAENADFNASGGDITVEDIDGIQLGTVTLASNTDPTIGTNAGDLTLTANGAVTQTGPLTVPGETQVTTTADTVTLDNAGNDFTGSVSVDTGSGADVELTDVNAIVLGEVTADALTVTTGGTITDTAGEAMLASGVTTLDAGGFDIQLDNSLHDFAENADFNASGGDITVEDIDGIQLGTVTLAANTDPTIGTNAGDLTLTANGAVTQTGPLTVPGETQVTTTADTVTLDNAGNDFTGSVSVDTGSGADVELTDANAIVLGTVTADALTVTAGGDITDTVGEAITANGVTTLDAGTSDIVLDNVATHDFVGAVSASGANITVDDANAIELADIDATGNLSVTAAGTIDDGVVTGTTTDVDVVGTSTFVSSGNANITVDDNTNEFVGAVSALGADVTLGDASAIELGNIDATGNLSVTAVGAIDDGPQTVLDGDVDVTGTSTLVSTGGANVIVDDTTNEFVGAVTASGADVALGDTSAIVLADIDATGDLSVTSTGTITDTAGQAINAGGATTLDAGGFDIQLDNAGLHDFAENADFSASGGDITVEDVDGIQLGTVTLAANTDPTIGTNAGDLTLTANGAVTQTGPLTVPGETQVTTTADTVTLDNAGNDFTGSVSVDTGSGADVELTDANGLVLGEVTADALTVTTGGTITDTAGEAILASGETTLDAGGFDIQLDNSLHDFAENADFNASGGDITVVDVDGIQLGTVTLASNTDPTIGTNAGDLTLTANGAVTQTGPLTVPGETQVTTIVDTVTLDNAGNDFTGSVSVDTGAGADVELTDANAIVLGTVTADALTVTAGGDITDTVGEAILSSGETTLDAGTANIVLDNVDTHDFAEAASFNATGANVTVDDLDGIQLGVVTTTDDLSVMTGGTVIDTAGEAVTVGGETTLDAGTFDIDLDNPALHDFSEAASFNASGGDIEVVDVDGIRLGVVTTATNTDGTIGNGNGDLTLAAGGDITDTAGRQSQ